MSKEERIWFEVHATRVVERIEADGTTVAPDGFEQRYLADHPDLKAAVDSGHFRSGRHHWCRHGR